MHASYMNVCVHMYGGKNPYVSVYVYRCTCMSLYVYVSKYVWKETCMVMFLCVHEFMYVFVCVGRHA